MSNGDELAFPFEGGNNNGIQPSVGLTKREYAAIKIMASMDLNPSNLDAEHIYATYAAEWADALLKELEK